LTPSPLSVTATDPALALDLLEQQYGSFVLAAALEHFQIFDRLARRAMTDEALRAELGLAPRAYIVLVTALRAMGLIVTAADGKMSPSPMASEHLRLDDPLGTAQYLKVRGRTPEVVSFVDRLKNNTAGDYYIYRRGTPSMMDNATRCRNITLGLGGLARAVAPHLARCAALDRTRTLMDVGCGSGLYSIACLRAFPNLKVIALDHKNVLETASRLAAEFGVADRMEYRPTDMFNDPLPEGCDAVLISNVLHDWDFEECLRLVTRCGEALVTGGRLMIHQYFLNDGFDGPLAAAMHSVALFCGTRGRVYSRAECESWLRAAGCGPTEPLRPTAANMAVLAATKV
jgi:hypothetical protein